jgi:ribitol 2-dehydrogenase
MQKRIKKMSHTLQGKVAAITGAASGIGLSTAEALLAAGATVVFVDRDTDALEKTCTRLGSNAIPLEIDLLNGSSCDSLLSGILQKAGQLDIFHANAGSYIGGDLTETKDSGAIDQMLNLNVNAVIKNVHNVIPHMIERGTGDIVVTSSVAGHFPIPWEPVYSASKWAITSFVQTMRRQLFKHGVRVGSVSPGPVVSALLADWPEENLKKAKENGSLMDPNEVADAILYMLTRPRTVTIRDMVILPTQFDI